MAGPFGGHENNWTDTRVIRRISSISDYIICKKSEFLIAQAHHAGGDLCLPENTRHLGVNKQAFELV